MRYNSYEYNTPQRKQSKGNSCVNKEVCFWGNGKCRNKIKEKDRKQSSYYQRAKNNLRRVYFSSAKAFPVVHSCAIKDCNPEDIYEKKCPFVQVPDVSNRACGEQGHFVAEKEGNIESYIKQKYVAQEKYNFSEAIFRHKDIVSISYPQAKLFCLYGGTRDEVVGGIRFVPFEVGLKKLESLLAEYEVAS